MHSSPRLLMGAGWLAAWMVTAAAAAQDPTLTTDPALAGIVARLGQFFEGVSTGQAQSAFQELLSGSPLLKQPDGLKTLVAKTGELEAKCGRFRGFERLVVRRAGTDLLLVKYLYKCEQLPVVWYFTFYRNPAPGTLSPDDDTWRVVAVRFDTDLDTLWY